MSEDKVGFAKRLNEGMRERGIPLRPKVLMARFNARYPGPSVSFQAVSSWMLGKTIPRAAGIPAVRRTTGTQHS
jgi:hypothetical protein